MRGVRISFLLVVGLIGLVPRRGTHTPSVTLASEGVPRRARFLSPAEDLAGRLRVQGKDPRHFLFWEGYPLHVARKEPITSGDTRFDIVFLLQAIEFTPGDYVERYVLLDEAGVVQDVATVYWPSRLRLEIECARCSGDPSECFLEIRDKRTRGGPDTLPVPHVELGIEPGNSKKVYLTWTGTSRLGKVWIKSGHFNAQRATD